MAGKGRTWKNRSSSVTARRESAQQRQAEREARTNEEQIKLLLERPGNSKRERSRLAKAA